MVSHVTLILSRKFDRITKLNWSLYILRIKIKEEIPIFKKRIYCDAYMESFFIASSVVRNLP